MISSPITANPGAHLRFHLSDGSVESFIQPDQAKAQQIWLSIEPARFFAQPRLVIAGTYSKSVFVCSEIVRLDFLDPNCACWKFPAGYSDIVELSPEEFAERAHLDRPELMPKREDCTPVGDLLVSFSKLHFRNQPPIYLMVEFAVKLPAENQSFMRFLLSKSGMHVRLANGGVSLINLAHLAGYTVYPGVAQVPADSWLAEPADGSARNQDQSNLTVSTTMESAGSV